MIHTDRYYVFYKQVPSIIDHI